MSTDKVVVKTCKEYNHQLITSALADAFSLLGGLSQYIKPHQTVLIKPDLYHSTHPNEAKTTDPHIISSLAELISKAGAKCVIADSPNGVFTQSKLDNAYIKTKMLEASNNGHATLSSNDRISIINNPKGAHSRDIYIIDAINDADVIINVGKLRCDKNLGLIGCGQNLFGLIPGKIKELIKSRCYRLSDYYNYNIDIYQALQTKVVLNVLDGIVGCEANNTPRILNSIIIGSNPYAVDSTALEIINQSPNDNLLIQEACKRNMFDMKTINLGDNIEPLICSDYQFSTLTDNISNRSTKYFKRKYNSIQKRPVIKQSICKGCKVCVKACPMSAIQMQQSTAGEYATINYDKCIHCFKCQESCPYRIVETKAPFKYKSIDKHLQKRLHKDK